MQYKYFPVSTRRRFDVHTTSITFKRRRINVKKTSCAYWVCERNAHKNTYAKATVMFSIPPHTLRKHPKPSFFNFTFVFIRFFSIFILFSFMAILSIPKWFLNGNFVTAIHVSRDLFP